MIISCNNIMLLSGEAMLENFSDILKATFGQNLDLMPFIYMSLRSLFIYISGLVFVRFNKKFIGTRTPYNFMLFMMLGSMSAAAITGAAPFLPVYGAILSLIFLNKFIACLSFYFPTFERIFKGPAVLLVKNGKINWDNMKNNYITKIELINALQQQQHRNNLAETDFAFLATDGTINFIGK